MKGFSLGLSIGVALGILYAPQEGSKSRVALSKHTDDLRNRAYELFDQTKNPAQESV